LWPLLKPARMESAAGADMLKPVRTVAPTVSPVTLAEAKAHCRIDTADDDVLVQALIDTAVSHVDGYSGTLGRALLSQTWRQDFDGFYSKMRLPVGNVLSITSVTYYDADNAVQTLASTYYTALTDGIGPYVAEKPDQSWPSSYTRPDAVSITWTAGYGTTAASVPAAIRHALLLMIGQWYENREASVIGVSVADLPLAVEALLSPFRVNRV